MCLSVTALAGATRTLCPQLSYQKKALDIRIKINVGIELKMLSSKVMTFVAHLVKGCLFECWVEARLVECRGRLA